MKAILRRFGIPLLFLIGGAAVGYGYYIFYGCNTGCTITSNPAVLMVYTSIIGLLLYFILRKEGDHSCNT